jgi:hypothetical protein
MKKLVFIIAVMTAIISHPSSLSGQQEIFKEIIDAPWTPENHWEKYIAIIAALETERQRYANTGNFDKAWVDKLKKQLKENDARRKAHSAEEQKRYEERERKREAEKQDPRKQNWQIADPVTGTPLKFYDDFNKEERSEINRYVNGKGGAGDAKAKSNAEEAMRRIIQRRLGLPAQQAPTQGNAEYKQTSPTQRSAPSGVYRGDRKSETPGVINRPANLEELKQRQELNRKNYPERWEEYDRKQEEKKNQKKDKSQEPIVNNVTNIINNFMQYNSQYDAGKFV